MVCRGDNVNGFSVNDRTPDPDRLTQAYFHSSATLNHIRGLLDSGFADLHAPLSFTFDHVRDQTLQQSYEDIVDSITDSLDFMKTVGADPSASGSNDQGTLNRVDYFVSHEGLMLEYEEALTREVRGPSSSRAGPEAGHYNLSTHLLWLGDRTRAADGAHMEYFRGIKNPIGIKVGPSMKPDELVRVLDIVDPDCIPGRVTLIGRFGASKVENTLPPLIKAVQASPHASSVIWTSDPMHGNTVSPPSHPSIKTRRFEDIVFELSASFRVHAECGSRLGGAHLELTGELDEEGNSVTECVGGSMQLGEEELQKRYLVSIVKADSAAGASPDRI
jgi:3-deoxy-7-phosphoheptulonate synthase